MTIKENINNFYNKERDKKREIGRYYASELWYIYKGYTNPTNFFKQKEVDKNGQANMFRGSAMEGMLCSILNEEKVDFKTQTKLELNITSDIIISGKLDFDFPEFIVETKCPDKEIYEVPDKWKMQMEFYHRATGKKVYLGIFYKNGEEIIRFFPYEPSDELWETIKTMITTFNEKVVKKKVAELSENNNVKKSKKCK